MPRLLILLLLLGCDDADKSGTTDDLPPDDTAERTDEDGDGYFVEGDEDGEQVDCDDGDAATHPEAADPCGDDIDQDCDGAAPACPCPDGDGDGYVLDDGSGCDAGEDALDCDDADPTTNPGELESCNGKDDDCDALIDEVWTGEDATDTTDTGDTGGEEAPDAGLGYEIYGRDADGDGFGDPGDTMYACEGAVPEGYLGDTTDCDDADASDHPGAEEICDEENDDDDCDDLADDDDPDLGEPAADYEDLFSDGDNDGYGAADGFTLRTDLCDPPDTGGWSRSSDDCDDDDESIHPDAVELCDDADTDEDCDGEIDDLDLSVDTATYNTWYEDADGDLYTTNTSTLACDPPEGYTASSSVEDCDDTDEEVNPAELETCDGKDEDCDGQVDEADSIDASIWYADTDDDGFGDPMVSSTSCYGGEDWVLDATDCDDTDPTVSPDGVETCDGEDDDCNGENDDNAIDASPWYIDDDGDTYGWIYSTKYACERPGGYVADNTDCDDDLVSYHATATFYEDLDGDGYGQTDVTSEICGPASGRWVAFPNDCDESDAKINPKATEVCDSRDNDCNGLTDDDDRDLDESSATVWYTDEDGDGYGYGDDGSTSLSCEGPSGHVANRLDCDDTSDDVRPGAAETCNGEDDDCDGTIDEGLAATTWSLDDDGDGYGDPSSTAESCGRPSSDYVSNSDDCDDDDATVSPDAEEACGDDVDSDCDGEPQSGCGLMRGTLCGWAYSTYTMATCNGYDPQYSCPEGYQRIHVNISGAGGSRTKWTCMVTTAATCTGAEGMECDLSAVPEGAICGLDGPDLGGYPCGDSAEFDLDEGRCPEGYSLIVSGDGGVFTCGAEEATGGVGEDSFLCDWSWDDEATPDLTCPGGFQSDYGDCPPGCEAVDYSVENLETCACN